MFLPILKSISSTPSHWKPQYISVNTEDIGSREIRPTEVEIRPSEIVPGEIEWSPNMLNDLIKTTPVVDFGTIPGVMVTPEGNYPIEPRIEPADLIEETIIEQRPIFYDRIEDPTKPKTYYASIEKMDNGGAINTPTIPTFSPLAYNNNYFSSNLYLPVVSGRRSDRILNRIDRRANRAADRIESGNMNINRWDRLGNQYARDVRRLNEINSANWSGYLPEEVTNPKEVVMNYLTNIGLNEFKNRKTYPWHY